MQGEVTVEGSGVGVRHVLDLTLGPSLFRADIFP